MEDRQEAKDAKNSCAEPGEILDDLARRVIGAAIEVHRHLGPGFSELVYEEALSLELKLRGIAFTRQPSVRVRYKGQVVGSGRPDFIVGGALVVEIKAVTQLVVVHQAQVISYLKAIGSGLGLLLNFRCASMRSGIKRVVWGRGAAASQRQQEAREMNEPHETAEGLVEAGGDASIALEVVEEDLDAIA
jgi:GxxExxY protein